MRFNAYRVHRSVIKGSRHEFGKELLNPKKLYDKNYNLGPSIYDINYIFNSMYSASNIGLSDERLISVNTNIEYNNPLNPHGNSSGNIIGNSSGNLIPAITDRPSTLDRPIISSNTIDSILNYRDNFHIVNTD